MNYLAHVYLSFDEPEVMSGNLAGDFIKGKQIETLPEKVRKGVCLHRRIDEFTDKHPLIKETKLLFRNSAGRYDGTFLDIAFDYFLANDPAHIPDGGWENFVSSCYNEIDKRLAVFTPSFHRMYYYMKKENWLYNYRYKWRIKYSFEGITRHAKFLPDDADVYKDFEKHFDQIQKCYELFFPELEDFSWKSYIELEK